MDALLLAQGEDHYHDSEVIQVLVVYSTKKHPDALWADKADKKIGCISAWGSESGAQCR